MASCWRGRRFSAATVARGAKNLAAASTTLRRRSIAGGTLGSLASPVQLRRAPASSRVAHRVAHRVSVAHTWSRPSTDRSRAVELDTSARTRLRPAGSDLRGRCIITIVRASVCGRRKRKETRAKSREVSGFARTAAWHSPCGGRGHEKVLATFGRGGGRDALCRLCGRWNRHTERTRYCGEQRRHRREPLSRNQRHDG
jgi:hypothetical protein